MRYRFVPVVHGGRIQPGVVETYLTNSRAPHALEMDLRAQIAAANVAKGHLHAIFRRYGLDTVLTVMQDMLDHSETRLRNKLRSIPDGRWYAEDYLDHEGQHEEIYVTRLALEKRGDRVVFDYRGTDDQAPAFINGTRTVALADTYASVLVCLCNDIPWNQGAFRNVDVLTRPGSLVDATFPAPVGSGPVNAGGSVTNVACAALGKMLACSEEHAQEVMAVWAGATFLINVTGKNQYGEPFGTMLINSALAGGGGRCLGDGYDFSGQLRFPRQSVTNVESAEARFPLLYAYRRRVVDSGGPGRLRGGVCAESAITPYDTDVLRMTLNTLGCEPSRSVGLGGGYPGSGSNARLVRSSDVWQRLRDGELPRDVAGLRGELHLLPPKQTFELRHGDVFAGFPPGGGGLQDPLLRAPEAVHRDVARGLVSREAARTIYGVVVDGVDGSPRAEDTEQERRRLRSARLGGRASIEPAFGPGVEPRRGRLLGLALRLDGQMVRCAYCWNAVSASPKNYKRQCLRREVDLRAAGPWLALRWQGMSPRFCLIEYLCPHCGYLVDVEERRRGEEDPWEDVVM